METYEDDDDTHFCIKCHLTINGLDNYVRHRQSGCRPPETKQETTHEPPTTPTTVTYPEILNADAFFSSLELQSSSKSNPTPRSRNLTDRERKTGKSEDKKKKIRRCQEADDGSAKEKLLNMPPVVTDLDDLMDHLGIPSLVGFPEIVTSTANKSSAIASSKLSCTVSSSKVNNDDNLRDSPLEGLMTSSKVSNERKRNPDSQRIDQDHGEWLEDTILDDLDANSENKEAEHGELTSYTDYDYQQDEDSDDESPEEEIGDEDSYSDDDYTEDHEYPHHGHTGGKWKPSELLQDIGRFNDDELEQDYDNQEHQPIPHTGGKWKPADSSQLQRFEAEDDIVGTEPKTSSHSVTSRQEPSPGHTREKWIPGVEGDSGSGYWCDPCGRKLASKLLYNRHLLSDLHARRSIQEIDGDSQLPRGVALLLQRKSASKRQKALAEIKSRSKISNRDEDKETTKKKTRRREKEVLWCEMCHARVRRPQMGKHLLSHYHCRVAGTNPCNSPAARRFILENMGNVVRQCPFQCASCRFYCNTEDTFLLHWRSKFHTTRFNDPGGSYKCISCNFWCTENKMMDHHLQSSGHREVVAMMNGSVPVVVRRQRSLVCETCNQQFRYNVELRFHVRETGHRGNVTSTDEYQSKIACGLCSQVVRSLVALQRHQLSCHDREKEVEDEETKVIVQPSAPYFCSFCTLNFATAREAVLHRRTLKHKEIVKAQKLSTENISTLGRECPHCGAKQCSLLEHKDHLLERHPELCHRCPRCGMLFALPQDVTRHTRSVECTKTITEEMDRVTSNDEEWRCNNCPFVTDSQAEFIFHDALHAGSIDTSADEAGSSKVQVKYRCPMCEKSFPKGSLRNHIRNHTGERPFRCVKCSASFARRSGLNVHRKECINSSASSLSWTKGAEGSRQRNHICSECNTAFYTNHLASHYVSYQEVYTKRNWALFKKVATRINYRWEHYIARNLVDECCPGYEPQGIQTKNCYPICRSGCLNGKCIEPNECACNLGYREVVTEGQSHCVPHCTDDGPDGCGDYASCIAPNTCICHTGYSFTITHTNGKIISGLPCIPKCKTECGKNSFCLSPNKCSCNFGYTRIKTEIFNDDTFNCEPSCVPECTQNMNCYAPNICQCEVGYAPVIYPDMNFTRNDDQPEICSPVCDPPCIDGTCTSPSYCECNRGYKKMSGNLLHQCSPICDPPCINGACISPDYCECHRGYKKMSGNLPHQCSPICDPPCINGACTKPDYCECHRGYDKISRNLPHQCSPVCDPPCINGTCISPDNCECHRDYNKISGNLPHQCSPVCDPPCINGICTKPDYCECHRGYDKISRNLPHQCSPICDPPCINGACTKPDYCECHRGYDKISRNLPHQCSPVCDPPCINGTCISPDNCECHRDYNKISGNLPHQCSPVCDPSCINGTCTKPDYCECHRGYDKISRNLPHQCSPICDPPCINGTCISPDYCECHRGYRKMSGNLPHQCSPVCDPPCINGTCTKPDYCECYRGYDKISRNLSHQCSPVCDPPCINGTCISPDNCECHRDYNKISGNLPHQCSPVCDPPCINGTCTKPGYCECHSGYKKNLKTSSHTCLPDCDPPCINATCTRPNYCECHNGYEKKLESLSQLCSPICDPKCNPNAFCDAPNKCHCNNGYTIVIMMNSYSSTTANSLRTIEESSLDFTEISCKPVCEPKCKENESCVAPNICQCDPGYREDIVDANLTQCLPICEPSCINAYCGYPNKCICLSGYKPNNVTNFICDPICQNDCFYATCTLPNHCECYDGYEKALTPIESPEDQRIYENTCIPSCPGQCLNGTCIAPGQCLCDPGYVLSNTLLLTIPNAITTDYAENSTISINETSVQLCQPFCQPSCPIGSECLSPNQCESQPDDNQDFNESSINASHFINSIEDCGKNVDFLNENGKCICKYGWTGWQCEEPSLCGLIFRASFEDNEKSTTVHRASSEDDGKSTTLQSIIVLSNDTIEPNYDNISDMRMMSTDDESGVLIDWQGPMCMEECRVFMTSLKISENRSDQTVNCYLLDSENVTAGLLSIRDQALLPGSKNGTLVCFISFESECNLSKMLIVGGSFQGLIGGIIGAFVLLAFVIIIGLAVYYHKNKIITVSPAVSMSNSTMLIHRESMCSLYNTEESSSL